jgi:hypothetical protein
MRPGAADKHHHTSSAGRDKQRDHLDFVLWQVAIRTVFVSIGRLLNWLEYFTTMLTQMSHGLDRDAGTIHQHR